MKRLYRIRVGDYDGKTRKMILENIGEDEMSSEYDRDIIESDEYDRKREEKSRKLILAAQERKRRKEEEKRKMAEEEAARLAKYDWIPKYPIGSRMKSMINSKKSWDFRKGSDVFEYCVIGYNFGKHTYRVAMRQYHPEYPDGKYTLSPIMDNVSDDTSEQWLLENTFPSEYSSAWPKIYLTERSWSDWWSLPFEVRNKSNAIFNELKRSHNKRK